MTKINLITREDVEHFTYSLNFEGDDNNALSYYQTIATKCAIYPGQGTPLGLAYVALKLNGEAGEFAEHVGKAMRDDALIPVAEGRGSVAEGMDENDGIRFQYAALSEQLTPARKLAIIKEIGDVLWYLSAACNELGISLSDAALVNLQKLCDRGERDALRGSGDER